VLKLQQAHIEFVGVIIILIDIFGKPKNRRMGYEERSMSD
jgi:hypothetical protein